MRASPHASPGPIRINLTGWRPPYSMLVTPLDGPFLACPLPLSLDTMMVTGREHDQPGSERTCRLQSFQKTQYILVQSNANVHMHCRMHCC
mmetsp:Transcript_29107/g.39987  ORF Transcript_29107/g.39987 Transcript_29107/m.39987 type:complete len:91 (+) Transcript_29107:343-615(+)